MLYLKKLKKDNPDKVSAITGCMMQQEGRAEKLISKFPFIDIIIGTHNAYKCIWIPWTSF